MSERYLFLGILFWIFSFYHSLFSVIFMIYFSDETTQQSSSFFRILSTTLFWLFIYLWKIIRFDYVIIVRAD